MAYIVNDDCTCCMACFDECPVGAISEKSGSAFIDDSCTECGACADVCPVEAISAD